MLAVDLGVLNVTRYETPAPEKFFFSQRRLGAEIRDLYGKLIDGMRADGTVQRIFEKYFAPDLARAMTQF